MSELERLKAWWRARRLGRAIEAYERDKHYFEYWVRPFKASYSPPERRKWEKRLEKQATHIAALQSEREDASA